MLSSRLPGANLKQIQSDRTSEIYFTFPLSRSKPKAFCESGSVCESHEHSPSVSIIQDVIHIQVPDGLRDGTKKLTCYPSCYILASPREGVSNLGLIIFFLALILSRTTNIGRRVYEYLADTWGEKAIPAMASERTLVYFVESVDLT